MSVVVCRCRVLGIYCIRVFSFLIVYFWGIEEVVVWLEYFSFCEYKDIFTRYDIRGFEFLYLERRDFKVFL